MYLRHKLKDGRITRNWDLAWRAAQRRPGSQPCKIETVVAFPLGLMIMWHYDGVEMHEDADSVILCSETVQLFPL